MDVLCKYQSHHEDPLASMSENFGKRPPGFKTCSYKKSAIVSVIISIITSNYRKNMAYQLENDLCCIKHC